MVMDALTRDRGFNVIMQACGASVSDYVEADGGKEGLVLGVKDVGDMLDFDEQQVCPVYLNSCMYSRWRHVSVW